MPSVGHVRLRSPIKSKGGHVARQRGFEVQCINIRVHTKHEASEYEAFWKAIGRLRYPIKWRAGTALMIGESAKRLANHAEGFYGQFYQFVEINESDPWFDISKHKPADADDVAKVSIPTNLRANLYEMPYFFDVHKHRLYFLAKAGKDTLSAAAVYKLLEMLSDFHLIKDRFGKVDLTIATEREAVEKLLDWPVLKRLTIKLERPNPTDYEDEQAVFDHLNSIGVKSEKREYQLADARTTIRPDKEMRQLAVVAGDNGEVEVSGTDPQGKRRTANSQHFRWSIKRFYDQNRETRTEAFLRTVSDLFTHRL
jgi:hypothetical protein